MKYNLGKDGQDHMTHADIWLCIIIHSHLECFTFSTSVCASALIFLSCLLFPLRESTAYLSRAQYITSYVTILCISIAAFGGLQATETAVNKGGFVLPR